MVTTKYLMDNYNFQTLLWDSAAALAWTVRVMLALVAHVAAVINNLAVIATPFVWPAAKALALTAVLVGAMIVTIANPFAVVCVLGLAAFAYATYPSIK